MNDSRADRWRGRALTAEAMVWLCIARFLVRFVRFSRWRALIGSLEQTATQGRGLDAVDRRVGAAIVRAAGRLPSDSRCLPRAIAALRMLHARGRRSQLVFATLHGSARGTLDDLHAWVEREGEIVIGEISGTYHPIARFGL